MINGGNFRFAVFREDRDRELILEKLVNFAERFLGRYSLSDLAERLGGMTVGGLCATRYKMSRRLQPPEETDLCAAAKGLVRSLAEEHKVTKWD
ncbi:MAG: hypothetical protein HN742_39570 [Lentisphaerae bacterium]|jgi:hypothetical protein|nr:hypothetical protein [Lentisphaerota bacterium]MBT5612454.1 hypothetical protein [Lentisphaerota bacterium]MBT7057160.1 hypothetical protein [Lentisphaerota bacterium]MBT7848034.1 hypothetical protein [Lentisphaerota bacterium]